LKKRAFFVLYSAMNALLQCPLVRNSLKKKPADRRVKTNMQNMRNQ
jgi:hypothetical protein